ncbi:MAG: B3/B4 domain-containing protein [Acidobacteriota bacterium]
MTTPFRCDPDLAAIVRPGVLWWEDATVIERHPRLGPLLVAAADHARSHPPPESAAVRAMYRLVGLDPTKTRPSSEALLRRVRKGDPLPRINALVDVVNWCSLEFQLPYGVYDRRHLQGPVSLRRGRSGEEYAGIRKDVVHVGGRICLADDHGPFGNPTSDSARTMVTSQTVGALVVVFAPREVTAARVSRVLDLTAARMADLVGGREGGRHVCE